MHSHNKYYTKIVKIDNRYRLWVRNCFEKGDWVVIKRENNKIVMEKLNDNDVIHISRVDDSCRIKLGKDVAQTLKNLLGSSVLMLVKVEDGKVIVGVPEFRGVLDDGFGEEKRKS